LFNLYKSHYTRYEFNICTKAVIKYENININISKVFITLLAKGGLMLPQIDIFSILAIFLAIGAVYIIGILLVLPIKIIVKLVMNGIIGAVALFVINIFGNFFGLTIGINPVTALIAGFLGIPGIILLLFLQYFL